MTERPVYGLTELYTRGGARGTAYSHGARPSPSARARPQPCYFKGHPPRVTSGNLEGATGLPNLRLTGTCHVCLPLVRALQALAAEFRQVLSAPPPPLRALILPRGRVIHALRQVCKLVHIAAEGLDAWLGLGLGLGLR